MERIAERSMEKNKERETWRAREFAIAVLALLGGLAVAMGLTTPGNRLDSFDVLQKNHDARINRIEQSQEDMRDDLTEIKRDVKILLRRTPQ